MVTWAIYHEYYDVGNYSKYETAYYRPTKFVQKYLQNISPSETLTEKNERAKLSENYNVCRKEINKILAFLTKSITNTVRNGTESYMQRSKGLDGGVDGRGASIEGFMVDGARNLMVFGRIGIYVDMPSMIGPTKASSAVPYLYYYAYPDICNWKYERGVLTYLVVKHCGEFLQFTLQEDGVLVQSWKDGQAEAPTWSKLLDIPAIPFIDLNIYGSVMAEAVDSQIALINLQSSIDASLRTANIPFYTEQQALAVRSNFSDDVDQPTDESGEDVGPVDEDRRVEVNGKSIGRIYPKGMERPGFISMSTDPAKTGMERVEILKKNIADMIQQNFGQLADGEMTEGLNSITLQLQTAENQIINLWGMYENQKSAGQAIYPRDYVFTDNRSEVIADLTKTASLTGSPSFKRAMLKRIANVAFTGSLTQEELKKIHDEIDKAPAIVTDPAMIHRDVEIGIASAETAAMLRGYEPGEAAKANLERAERLKQMAIAQGDSHARGVPDTGVNPDASKNEKAVQRDNTRRAAPTNSTRGPGKVKPNG